MILISITGNKKRHWQDKFREVKKHGIKEAALFLEYFNKKNRMEIYEKLAETGLKKIPLVHARNDMDAWEFEFLKQHFGSKVFTIHEDSFDVIPKWRGHYKELYLEMNYDNKIPKNVDVKKIGGFCVDLSHFKAGEEKWSKDFLYVQKNKKLVFCNHLNGYDYKKNKDIHTIKSLKEFEYLKTLPAFVFSDVIAIETYNSITRQLEFRKHVQKIIRLRLRELKK